MARIKSIADIAAQVERIQHAVQQRRTGPARLSKSSRFRRTMLTRRIADRYINNIQRVNGTSDADVEEAVRNGITWSRNAREEGRSLKIVPGMYNAWGTREQYMGTPARNARQIIPERYQASKGISARTSGTSH